ncbi:MAG: hypothetical protein COW59_08905 [Lysobacterales bacterium CG17_big_fil_post_rev_8_21_14_2_50_64_11]|nr:MAG: hypothetical protein COW59_08905 [Xanthomonadales bacterium CG17_big_fil_post_rev_8_21_14_2_50_64_11]PIX61256.1 MAG: hypothetical protein COZ47_02915 [Xanthomonadales bacterium CG_4_10_14_3_um_filter_64_11]
MPDRVAASDAISLPSGNAAPMFFVDGNAAMAVVPFGVSNIEEAQFEICRQARAWRGKPVLGNVLRVQRQRGSLPALDARMMVCR